MGCRGFLGIPRKCGTPQWGPFGEASLPSLLWPQMAKVAQKAGSRPCCPTVEKGLSQPWWPAAGGLTKKTYCFQKYKSFSPFSTPIPNSYGCHPSPLISPGSLGQFPHPQPGGTPALLPVPLAQPGQAQRAMDAPGPLGACPPGRVCGLDEFTLPSIPKYDHIWGRRSPCG